MRRHRAKDGVGMGLEKMSKNQNQRYNLIGKTRRGEVGSECQEVNIADVENSQIKKKQY